MKIRRICPYQTHCIAKILSSHYLDIMSFPYVHYLEIHIIMLHAVHSKKKPVTLTDKCGSKRLQLRQPTNIVILTITICCRIDEIFS